MYLIKDKTKWTEGWDREVEERVWDKGVGLWIWIITDKMD